jgi:hypothetical protein
MTSAEAMVAVVFAVGSGFPQGVCDLFKVARLPKKGRLTDSSALKAAGSDNCLSSRQEALS